MAVVNNEYRVARSASSDATFNTLELKRQFNFATMEFLDPSDSQHFASTLSGKSWRDLTPEPHKSRKTFQNRGALPGELDAFKGIGPDWFYLSGHYGRGVHPAVGRDVTFPAGFFNEPFHQREFESAWSKTDGRSVFVQAESLSAADAEALKDYVSRQTLVIRMRKGDKKFESDDERDPSERAPEWAALWREPQAVVEVSGVPTPPDRGLLFSHVWAETRLVLLVCCNAILWSKELFRRAFPNALVLGWIGKNPVNSTPFVRQFLINAFRDAAGASDPILMNHDHLAKAWMDIHYKQRLFESFKLAYMKTDGTVFSPRANSATPTKEGAVCGSSEIIVGRPPLKTLVFGINVGGDFDASEP